MSKITLSTIVYAPCLHKTTIKTNKKQLNSSADTFFGITRYHVLIYSTFISHFRRTPRGRRVSLPLVPSAQLPIEAQIGRELCRIADELEADYESRRRRRVSQRGRAWPRDDVVT